MKVVVVGGGLSGLFIASDLLARGVDDIFVVERSDRPGGVAATITSEGFTLEAALGSIPLPHPNLTPLIDRVGVEAVAAPSDSTARFVFIDDRLVAVPPSPGAMLAPLMPVSAKLRAVIEPLVRKPNPSGDESLDEFCRRRFGSGAGRLIAWLMATGVFAGDPQRLSARSAFPMLTGLEERAGSVIRGALHARRSRRSGQITSKPHVIHGGMSRLAGALVEHLGHRYRGGFDVSSVRRQAGRWIVGGSEDLVADQVVIATHPADAAGLVDHTLAAHLRKTSYAPVLVVWLGGSRDPGLPRGFGVLVGPDEAMLSRGVLIESSYAPERAPGGGWLLKVIVGGPSNHGLLTLDDREVTDRVLPETRRIMDVDLEPGFSHVMRHSPGIPQLDVGHDRWLRSLGDLLGDRAGLHLSGWGYRGVGVTHLVAEASAVATRIAGGSPRSG